MSSASQSMTEPQGLGLLQSVDLVLRDLEGVLRRIGDRTDLSRLVRAMILTVAVGGGIFGATMGSFRGGVQILYAAVKLPLVLLLTTAVCAPALTALNRALGRESCLRQDLSLVLCSLGRTSLVVAAEAPIVLLAVRLGASYHAVVVLVVGCCAIAGGLGLSLLLQGLRLADRRALVSAAVALLTVFGFVGTQMSWSLRPFLVRPRTPDVPFVRAVEGSFFDAVRVSVMSARGIYTRDEAPLPGRLSPSDAPALPLDRQEKGR